MNIPQPLYLSELLPLPRMARRLGVSAEWLKEETMAGRIPALKADGRLMFRLDAVLATLAERATKPLPQPAGVNHGS